MDYNKSFYFFILNISKFICWSKMGACGSDMLERFGPEFGKFVAVEKGKKFLDEKVHEVKNTLASRST